jgi:hypothetical protein
MNPSMYTQDKDLRFDEENKSWIEATRAYRNLHMAKLAQGPNPASLNSQYLRQCIEYLVKIMAKSRTSLLSLKPLAVSESFYGLFEHYEAHFIRTTGVCRRIISRDLSAVKSRLESERSLEEELRSPEFEDLEIMVQTLEQCRICLDRQYAGLIDLTREHNRTYSKLRESLKSSK